MMKTPTIPALQTSPPDVAGLAEFLKERFDDLTLTQAKEAVAFVKTASTSDTFTLLGAVVPSISVAWNNLVLLGTKPSPEQEEVWLEWQRLHKPSLKVMNSLQKRAVFLYNQDPSAFSEEVRVEKKENLTLMLSADSVEEASSQEKDSRADCTS